MSTRERLEWAIVSRTEIEFVYTKRQAEGPRQCRPHVLFESASGKLLLDAYQTGGHSSDGRLPSWRRFEVAHISDLVSTNQRFDLAPGYNPSNPERYPVIIARC